jgi:hypothetical protein
MKPSGPIQFRIKLGNYEFPIGGAMELRTTYNVLDGKHGGK